MPRTPILAIAAVVVIVLAGAGGVLAYDSSRSDVIANGVRIGGVDVGGLTTAEAQRRVTQRLVAPLRRPVIIHSAGQTFPLSAREAHISANVAAMVHTALQRSRSGGVLGRTWRGLSGGTLHESVAPQIAYSRDAVQRIVDRVRVAVSRKPKDARVDFHPETIAIRQARTGRTIDAGLLRGQVQSALVSPTQPRVLQAAIQTVKPKVTGEKLASRYPTVITVDRSGFRLSLFKKLKRVQSYPIAVGQAGLETPAGLYKIQNKATNPAWHVPNSAWAGSLAGQVIPGGAPNNPIKARWLGVADGVGVHGTDARGSIGSNASHGCIRMLIEDVEKLYDEVPVGTPIFIH